MKIVREGKEIELTGSELFQAYLEQEHLFDIQNIEENMGAYLEPDEFSELKDNNDFIQTAAYTLRRNQDKYDMCYENALDNAIQNTKNKFLHVICEECGHDFGVKETFMKDFDGCTVCPGCGHVVDS